MDWQTPVNIPESLRYGDGLYVFERFSRAGAVTSVRDKRIVTRFLRALHWTLRFRRETLRGIARDPRNDTERQAVSVSRPTRTATCALLG